MRLCEKDRCPFEKIKILKMVIDHDIGVNDRFASAKNYLLPGQKAEMFIKPIKFFGKTLRKFHCRRNNEQLIILIQLSHYFHTVFYHWRGSKKSFCINVFVYMWKCASLFNT